MKWIECKGLLLDCEQILYKTDTPEIFICIDQKGTRYLTIFEDDAEYLLVPLPLADIIQLVSNRVTIYECVKNQTDCFMLRYRNKQYSLEYLPTDSLDPDYLPDKNVYIDASLSIQTYYAKVYRESYDYAEEYKTTIEDLSSCVLKFDGIFKNMSQYWRMHYA